MSGPEQEQQKPLCWSYSAETMERCSLPAGHSLEHQVVRYTRWDDAGAFTPEKMFTPSPVIQQAIPHVTIPATAAVMTPTEVADLDAPSGCYNCPHPAHDEVCTVLVTAEKLECGCSFRGI
jgi:hypothetical protein